MPEGRDGRNIKKKIEITQRKYELSVFSGQFFGKKNRSTDELLLRISGVFFFVMGIMGFILERCLYKKAYL
jgi:hypothetical protein